MKPVIRGEFGSISCEQGEQEKREGSDLLSNLHPAALCCGAQGGRHPGQAPSCFFQPGRTGTAREASSRAHRSAASFAGEDARGVGRARLQPHRRRGSQGRGGTDSSLPPRNEAVPAAQF